MSAISQVVIGGGDGVFAELVDGVVAAIRRIGPSRSTALNSVHTLPDRLTWGYDPAVIDSKLGCESLRWSCVSHRAKYGLVLYASPSAAKGGWNRSRIPARGKSSRSRRETGSVS